MLCYLSPPLTRLSHQKLSNEALNESQIYSTLSKGLQVSGDVVNYIIDYVLQLVHSYSFSQLLC